MLRAQGQRALGRLLRNVHKHSVESHEFVDTAMPPAFVFDIDGVLVRGKTILPAARAALKLLYQPDRQTPKVPVAFLTNGGGVTEEAKAAQLSEWLDVRVEGSQVVLSHTPFRQFAAHFADKPVVVVGRGKVVEVAQHYGFRRVTTTQQLAQATPHSVPFWHGKAEWLQQPTSQRPLFGTADDPIAAVFIFNDPTDWYMDLQLLFDVITSGGVLGRSHADVPLDTPPVEVFFSNPDLLWANEHSVARFGQGAFAVCLEALHQKVRMHMLLLAMTCTAI
jgi:HAD superfamily hydrolase (TIGR01456 family)